MAVAKGGRVLAPLAGMMVAVLLLLFAPPGVDLPAHRYLSSLFQTHGFMFWNNYWYGGSYSFVGYSLLSYPLAILISLPLFGLMSIGGAFAACSYTARRLPLAAETAVLWTFCLSWPFTLLSGAYPYLAGFALAGWAGVAYIDGRKLSFAVLFVLCWTASPLALLFVGIAVISMELEKALFPSLGEVGSASQTALVGRVGSAVRILSRSYWIYAVGSVFLLEVGVSRAFSTNGAMYPFFGPDLVLIMGFLALLIAVVSPSDRLGRIVWIGSLSYGVLCILAFFIPSDLGANLNRISELSLTIVVFILVMGKAKRGVLLLSLVVLSGFWYQSLLSSTFFDRSGPQQAKLAYWSPSIGYLKAHLRPGERVELVDSASHAGDYFLAAAQIPLLRGWYRQDDFPSNSLLYKGSLTEKRYVDWLRFRGASYVVLPQGPYDFSSVAEAGLIKGGTLPLRMVFVGGGVSVYKVGGGPYSLAPRSIRVVSSSSTGVALDVPRRGSYLISLNYSPYFHPSSGCIAPTRNGGIILRVDHGGDVLLKFLPTPSRVFGVVLGISHRNCAIR